MIELKKNLVIRNLQSKDSWNHENAFYWFSHVTRINKLLAHYELYKMIIDLPGDVLELGVYKGASLIRLATFRQLLENDHSRKIVGFDTFGIFPDDRLTLDSDRMFILDFQKNGGDGLSVNEMEEVLFRKKFTNISLEKGNIFQSLPAYLVSYPATRIAFLHIDMDVKEPTAFALELLYDRVVSGGIVVIDDYCSVAGATNAVDEFLSKNNVQLRKLDNYSVPSFFIK